MLLLLCSSTDSIWMNGNAHKGFANDGLQPPALPEETSEPIKLPSSGIWRSTYRLREPEEFSHAVAGATLKADFLARQTDAARIDRYMGTNWALDFFKSGVKARVNGPILPQWISMCLVLSGLSRWRGVEAHSGSLLCNPPDTDIEGCIAPAFTGVAITIPFSMWEESRRLSGCSLEEMNGFQIIPLPPETYSRILKELTVAQDCLRGNSAACRDCATPASMGEHLARSLATAAWEHVARKVRPTSSIRNRFRLARRAEDWMRSHIRESFQVPDVCLALGVSRRELEYAFQMAFGVSPRDFLETLRMNEVRKALRRATDGESVTRIALSHGFNHLGRFSTRYRSFFGESPSDSMNAGELVGLAA